MNESDTQLLIEDLLARVEGWSSRWGVPGLAKRIDLEFSRRLRVSLGLARPREKLIRVNAALANHPRAVLEEVVCHEAAHIATHEIYRGYRRPHGPEWRDLMKTAGYEPRVRMALDTPLPEMAQSRTYEHSCPVCHAHRTARRPVRRWRCAACVDAGLSGELIITKRSARGAT